LTPLAQGVQQLGGRAAAQQQQVALKIPEFGQCMVDAALPDQNVRQR
jgi:hypothetical protein